MTVQGGRLKGQNLICIVSFCVAGCVSGKWEDHHVTSTLDIASFEDLLSKHPTSPARLFLTSACSVSPPAFTVLWLHVHMGDLQGFH